MYLDRREHAYNLAFDLNVKPHHPYIFQNENVNMLNMQRIKLENGVELKDKFISNILTRDMGTVNLAERHSLNAEAANDIQDMGALPNEMNAAHIPTPAVFCAAILTISKRNVTIKSTWIKDFSDAESYNKGVKTSNRHIVFYSDHINAEPNFDLPIGCELHVGQPALFVANIYRFFGETFYLK